MWLFGETKSKYEKAPSKTNPKTSNKTRGELREPAKAPKSDISENRKNAVESQDFEKDLPLKNLRPNDKRASVKVIDGGKEVGRTTVTKTHQGSFWTEKDTEIRNGRNPTGSTQNTRKENFVAKDESDSEESENDNSSRITLLEERCKTYEDKSKILEERCSVLETQYRDLLKNVESLRQVPLTPVDLQIPSLQPVLIPPQNHDNISIPCTSAPVEEAVVSLVSVSFSEVEGKKEVEPETQKTQGEVQGEKAKEETATVVEGKEVGKEVEKEGKEVEKEVEKEERKVPVIGSRLPLPPIRKQDKGHSTKVESPE